MATLSDDTQSYKYAALDTMFHVNKASRSTAKGPSSPVVAVGSLYPWCASSPRSHPRREMGTQCFHSLLTASAQQISISLVPVIGCSTALLTRPTTLAVTRLDSSMSASFAPRCLGAGFVPLKKATGCPFYSTTAPHTERPLSN